ncbi:hypothetical protein ACQ4LE_005280 [Meloidogyne hapla]|uniref:non-specific serine/threonine protein kinase n=1 Tax=Meloidogyne hapla TaxID=6305 RepID=A0A1I8C1M0_MELHA
MNPSGKRKQHQTNKFLNNQSPNSTLLKKKQNIQQNNCSTSTQSPSFNNIQKHTFPPTSIYDFHLLVNIGSGAFAQVYKGFELINQIQKNYREVALKRINLAAITDPAIYKTTVNEVKVFGTLDHPNIVKCYRSFEEISRFTQNRYLVLVLEYIDGGDLQTYIQDHAIANSCLLPENEIWYIFGQIAAAVSYIHSKRIIHRDLKPPNVLLKNKGIVKLADFGLSRLNLAVGCQAQTVCGTPYYMSPERIIEQPYTFASDVWSLGCILYEMAALKSPFYGEKENVQSLISKIRSAEFPPIPSDRYCAQLEFLIESCMHPNMEKRPNAFEVYKATEHMNILWTKYLQKMESGKLQINENKKVELNGNKSCGGGGTFIANEKKSLLSPKPTTSNAVVKENESSELEESTKTS